MGNGTSNRIIRLKSTYFSFGIFQRKAMFLAEKVVTHIIHALLVLLTKSCYYAGKTTICLNSVL